MNQIIYLEKEKLSKIVIEVFIGVLWIFSIGLIVMSIYNIYDINRNKIIVTPSGNKTTTPEIIENNTVKNEIVNNIISEEENIVANNEIIENTIVEKPSEPEKDTKPPTIKVTKLSGSLIIVVTDNDAMSYITYSWDGETPTKDEVVSGEEITIPIPDGEHVITIKAYDVSGNVKKFTKTYKKDQPVTPTPTTEDEQIIQNSLGDKIAPVIYHSLGSKIIVVHDDGGLSSVKYSVNGNWYVVPLEGNPTSIRFEILYLTENNGNNKIKIIAIDKSGNQKELEKVL